MPFLMVRIKMLHLRHEGNNTCRRFWNTASPDNGGGEQTTYAPNLVEFLLNKINDLTLASNMEHFSDGLTMSWYDLAKQLTNKKINKLIN